MENWPTLRDRAELMAEHRSSGAAPASRPARVEVEWRRLAAIKNDPEHLVGMQWEPWFTPRNASWNTAQAVPLLGFYWSWNPDVTRQHMIWLAESGADFLVVDWTNHLWGKAHWDERHGRCEH